MFIVIENWWKINGWKTADRNYDYEVYIRSFLSPPSFPFDYPFNWKRGIASMSLRVLNV